MCVVVDCCCCTFLKLISSPLLSHSKRVQYANPLSHMKLYYQEKNTIVSGTLREWVTLSGVVGFTR